MICQLCNQDKKLDKHHTSYEHNITIQVCRSCHKKIHCNKIKKYFPQDSSKTCVIMLRQKVKERLDSVKVHPRETYEDVIIRLLQGGDSS